MNFIKDEEGATAMEYGVITATIGAAIAVCSYYFGDMFSSLFYNLGDCIAMGFDPECYSVHANQTAFNADTGGSPSWFPHEY